MSARHSPADHIAYGSLDAYREFIAETLAGAEIHARIGQSYVEAGNDAGLEYSVRCLIANVRAAASILAELKKSKAEQTERRTPAPDRYPATDNLEVRA
ncbi:hypothetical protein AFCDBAGC_5132 [Methylobacterium cerastii]|uniref:Uncharacterized protein n=1 Tax=Methylobacterium cerastii TaxID=932741 RepID=A0ABQ4QRA9_9HYPH|nr:hypothetical protein [Methylobacterium cerastii]GJD47239.1 hypothetical protein AFCDBAGC_5132 [Methylobacterium cerastii]